MRPTKLVWTESAEDRLTGWYPGNRRLARVFAVVVFLYLWLCFVAMALIVPDTRLAWVLAAVVTVGFGVGGVAAARYGGRAEHRRRVARLQAEFPDSVLIACMPVDGMAWAVRQIARASDDGTRRPFLIFASFVVAVGAGRISFISGRRRMVLRVDDVVRIRRGSATVMQWGNAPTLIRSSIDLSFTQADGETVIVQLCPIPINDEPLHFFRPFELRPFAESIDLAMRGARPGDHMDV